MGVFTLLSIFLSIFLSVSCFHYKLPASLNPHPPLIYAPPWPRPRIPSFYPQRSTLGECFMLFPSQRVLHVRSSRATRATPTQCANLCVNTTQSEHCRSFVIDKMRGVCYLFAVTGKWPPAALQTNPVFDYYDMKLKCAQSDAKVVGYGGYSTRRARTTVAPPTETTTQELVTRTVLERTTRAIPNRSRDSERCKSPTAPMFLRSEGQMLKSQKMLQLPDTTEDNCVSLCAQDQTVADEYVCASLNYHYLERLCVLGHEKAAPEGSARLVPHFSVYLEKVCITEKFLEFCPERNQLLRIQNAMLIESKATSASVEDLAACIEHCLVSQIIFSVSCKSIMFYPYRTENCVLNNADHTEVPHLLRQSRSELVEYVSFDTCRPRKKRRQVLRTPSTHQFALRRLFHFKATHPRRSKIVNRVVPRFSQ